MKLRATVEFPDGCPDAVAEWGTVEAANRWGEVMEKLTPGSTFKDLEQLCDQHGWEDINLCGDCGAPVCPVDGKARVAFEYDDHLCESCHENRPEARQCQCPGGYELGPCSCPACI